MAAFRFDFSHGSSRAEPPPATALGIFVAAFRPGAREVAIEGSAELLEELLAEAPPGMVVGRRSLGHGHARVELHPTAEATWSTLVRAAACPVRIEVRGARGRDRTLLVVTERGDAVQGFVDDPGVLIAVEAELRACGSFTPRPVPRDGGGFGLKRLALTVGATCVGGPLGTMAAAADGDGLTAGTAVPAIAVMALGIAVARLIWRHAMRQHGGTWHGV